MCRELGNRTIRKPSIPPHPGNLSFQMPGFCAVNCVIVFPISFYADFFFFIPLQLGEGVCVCTHVHTSVPTLTYIHAIAYDLLRGIHLEKNRKDFNTASLQVPARAWGYEDANLKGQGHPFFALPLPPEGEERSARREGLFPAGRPVCGE